MPGDASSGGKVLAVIGCGNMGEAIIRAILRSPAPWWELRAFDPDAQRRQALLDLDMQWADSPAAAAAGADVILIAVKPQTMLKALGELGSAAAGRLVVSIAAGVTTRSIEAKLAGARVVRTMPNTPLLVGKGLVALSAGSTASAADLETARSIFPGATLLDVDEGMMDAVTAISGSGPAYFFAFVEALAAAGREQGFDAEPAARLAAGTFIGAAALLEASSADVSELRRRVTSPGGTTEAALAVLGERNFDEMVAAAVEAATRRGRALSGT